MRETFTAQRPCQGHDDKAGHRTGQCGRRGPKVHGKPANRQKPQRRDADTHCHQAHRVQTLICLNTAVHQRWLQHRKASLSNSDDE